MRTRSLFLVSFSVAVGLLAGCGGETPAPTEPTNPVASATHTAPVDTAPVAETPKEEPKKEEPPPPPPKKTAKEIVTPGSSFAFSLADSSDAKKAVDDECGKKKKQDKIDACTKEKMDAAASEGIRFEKDDKDNLVWVSYGSEKGKEVIYNKLPLTVKDAGADKLTVTAAGKDTGKRPLKMKKDETVTIEVPDESTVVLTDPKKGRLVYKKK